MTFFAAILAFLGACGSNTTPEHPAEPALAPIDCIEGGRLVVQTFGAIKSDIDWAQPDIQCEGMQRPDNEGARLRFAGEIDSASGARPMAFILSIPGMVQGATGNELATRVTMIEEENARFFSTRESDICWTNITEQTPLMDSNGVGIEHFYRVRGLTYCVAPIAELNGAASVTLSDLEFTGQLSWAIKDQ